MELRSFIAKHECCDCRRGDQLLQKFVGEQRTSDSHSRFGRCWKNDHIIQVSCSLSLMIIYLVLKLEISTAF